MKFHPLLLAPCALLACSIALAELPMIETFNQKPASATWHMTPQAKVLDGELILDATGPSDGYPTTAMWTKAGNAEFNFTKGLVELDLSGIQVSGAGVPANNLFMAFLLSDSANETKARSYLKIRLSADGTLLLNCKATDGKAHETTLQSMKMTLPMKRLTLSVTLEGFLLKGSDAARSFEYSGGWNDRLDLAAWKESAPYVMVKGVRRPGAGAAFVRLGEVAVRTSK
jgi:hypothetical protein